MIFILFFNFTNTASFQQCMLHYDLWLSSQTNDEKKGLFTRKKRTFLRKKTNVYFSTKKDFYNVDIDKLPSFSQKRINFVKRRSVRFSTRKNAVFFSHLADWVVANALEEEGYRVGAGPETSGRRS